MQRGVAPGAATVARVPTPNAVSGLLAVLMAHNAHIDAASGLDAAPRSPPWGKQPRNAKTKDSHSASLPAYDEMRHRPE